MVLIELNYVAVFAASAVSMSIGMLWFSPLIAGPAWLRAMNQSPKDYTVTPIQLFGEAVGTFVRAWILAQTLAQFGPLTIADGLIGVAALWLGLIAVTGFSGVVWGRLPFKAYLICITGTLLRMLAATVVLLTL